MKTSFHAGALVCALFLASIMPIFAQGSLTPPGAPAPTMKSLDQIASTGIAINATNTPGDTNYEAVIFAAGGYYLTSNSRDGFELGNDYVVRNSAFLNTAANYNPTTGGNYGPIEAASTSTHPWANF